jgi:hypothetical protein
MFFARVRAGSVSALATAERTPPGFGTTAPSAPGLPVVSRIAARNRPDPLNITIDNEAHESSDTERSIVLRTEYKPISRGITLVIIGIFLLETHNR